MSKVLVDRELLERLMRADADMGREGSASFTLDASDRLDRAWAELRAILAQPAEAEGVKRWALDVDCLYPSEEGGWCEYGDHLAALSAERARADVAVADANDAERALVAVTAERDAANSRLHEVAVACAEAEQERDQLRAEVDGLRNEHAARESMARRLLWLAFVWNDHNFLDAHIEARREAEAHGITTLEQANEWLSRIDDTLAAKEGQP